MNYFEGLASSHREIRHSERNPRFSTMMKVDFTRVSKDTKGPILQVYDISGGIRGNTDELIPTPQIGFMVWVGYQNEDSQSEQAAFDKSFRIGAEILAKIVEDQQSGCSPLNGFRAETVNFTQIDMEAHNFRAYLFRFPITGKIIEHNSDQWQ